MYNIIKGTLVLSDRQHEYYEEPSNSYDVPPTKGILLVIEYQDFGQGDITPPDRTGGEELFADLRVKLF